MLKENFMFNFDKLDKKKTYVGLQYGTSIISKQIRKLTKSFAPNSKEVPSHVLGLKYRLGTWWIFESHAKGDRKLGITDGVRRCKKEVWDKVETKNNIKFYPMKLNEFKLEDYIGQQYGVGDIESLMKACIINKNGKQKDREGIICSEYMALCNDEIQKFYNLPPHCITPAHFQNYFDTKKIQPVEL